MAFTVGVAGNAARAAAFSEIDLIRQAGFAESDVGFLVVDLRSGQIRREHQSARAFIPASMIKLMTAYAALEALGPDYRFSTPVHAVATGSGLHLHLSGGGDPVLVEEGLAALARTMARRVGGQPVARFTFDSDALPFISAIDPSDDIANSYNPPIAALSVNFNRQWLQWERPADHRALLVRLLPDLGDAVTGVAPLRATDGRPVQVMTGDITRVLIEPRVPSSGQRRIAVHQPALRTALMLQRLAGFAGLALPPPVQAARPTGGGVLAANESLPLLEIVEGLLRYSNNLSAEMVGLATAAKLGPPPASLEQSALTVQRWLGRSMPDLLAEGMYWNNLSGLSGEARLSPKALAAVLWQVRGHTYAGRPFLDLLTEPLWSERDDGLSIRAKSGTMSFARGQAGRLVTRDGREFLFVLMHSDLAARSRFESDPLRFGHPVRRQAGEWGSRARLLERAILHYWTETL